MELREFAAALRRGWWLVIALVLVGVGGGYGLSALLTPEYESSTQFFVATPPTDNPSDSLQGSTFSQYRVLSYTRLLTGPELASRVIERLDLDMSTDDLSEEIEASADLTSVLLDVTVTDSSARRAQAIAEVIGTEFPALVEDLETAGSGQNAPISVRVTGQPKVADSQSWPNLTLFLLIGGGVGLLLGIAAAVLRSRLDRSVKDPAAVLALTGAPVIGTVLRDSGVRKRHVTPEGPSPVGEDFRQLRNNLQFLGVDNPPKVIMITSALPDEGKTTAAVNLGRALAQAGRRVTIVDADLRAPKVTEYLDLVTGAGLTSVLTGNADLDDVLQATGDDSCAVLGAGPLPPNPGELLASASMATLLEKLREDNDFVIVDSPPLLAVADSTGLSVHVDGVILAVRYGRTRADQLEQASVALDRVGGRVLGVLLNIVPPKAQLARALGHNYAYGTIKKTGWRPTRRSSGGSTGGSTGRAATATGSGTSAGSSATSPTEDPTADSTVSATTPA